MIFHRNVRTIKMGLCQISFIKSIIHCKVFATNRIVNFQYTTLSQTMTLWYSYIRLKLANSARVFAGHNIFHKKYDWNNETDQILGMFITTTQDTVMILSFWTKRPWQTVQTQSDQGLHCLLFH